MSNSHQWSLQKKNITRRQRPHRPMGCRPQEVLSQRHPTEQEILEPQGGGMNRGHVHRGPDIEPRINLPQLDRHHRMCAPNHRPDGGCVPCAPPGVAVISDAIAVVKEMILMVSRGLWMMMSLMR